MAYLHIKNKHLRRWANNILAVFKIPWIAFSVIPKDNRILFHDRDSRHFDFLSNFYPCFLKIDDRCWPHVEAFYQSRKSVNPKYHERILQKEKPSWSKYVGDCRIDYERISKLSWFRKHPEDLRTDWDEIKVEVMKKALHVKFTQHENLRRALQNTRTAELIEDSQNDTFWGSGKDGDGKNMLGVLLMELRARLM